MDPTALMGQAERPDITDLPAFNELQEKVERFLSGQEDSGPSLEALSALEEVLARMLGHFQENLVFQEETETLRQAVPLVLEGLGKLRVLLPEVRQALESEAEGRVCRLLPRARKLVNQVFDGLFLLRQEESERPVYSQSTQANELVRVGQAFMLGKLPLERFRRRLDQFIEFHQALSAGLETMQPTPAERKVLGEVEETLREAMERQAEGIGRLEAYFDNPDVQELRLGLETVSQAGDQLSAIVRQLTGAETTESEPLKACLHCSAANPSSARYCQQCNAVFPAVEHLGDQPQGHLDMREEGETGPRATSENLQILAETVEQVKRKALSDEEFVKTLDWLAEKVAQVRQKLAKMEPAHPDTPADQLAVLEEAQAHMAQGADDFEAGLERLRAFLQRRDPAHLDRGLEMVAEAADVMLRVEELFRSLTSGTFPS